jgi:hypothetical protein
LIEGDPPLTIRRLPLFYLLLPLVLATASASSQTLIRVFVQTGSGDFAANGAGDSSLDMRKALLGKERTIRVVEAPAESDIVVRIDSRNVKKETASVNTVANQSKNGKTTTATTVPAVRITNVLHATIVAGDSQIPLESESLTWRGAAGDMASSVDHWIKENYAKLIERRAGEAHSIKIKASEEASGARPNATSAEKGSGDTSIAPGMAEAQVLEAMGTPDKKVTFGEKSLWNYRGLQVVFEEGKVTDVKF